MSAHAHWQKQQQQQQQQPVPIFTLRGHRSPIHSLAFYQPTNHSTNSTNSSPHPSNPQTSASTTVASHAPGSLLPSSALLPSPSVSPVVLLSGDASGRFIIWHMERRRALATVQAHSAPLLGIQGLADGTIVTQGKDGHIKLWKFDEVVPSSPAAPTAAAAGAATAGVTEVAPVHTIPTDSYTFLKMQVAEGVEMKYLPPSYSSGSADAVMTDDSEERKSSDVESRSVGSNSANKATLLLLPCETASNLALYDLTSREPLQLIECEKRIPRDRDLEENFKNRMSEEEADQLEAVLAAQPPQYERKVGMVMAAKFFWPTVTTGSTTEKRLCIAWASESGIVGVWDVKLNKQIGQKLLHKETITSMDVNDDGSFAVSCSSGRELICFQFDFSHGIDADSDVMIQEISRVQLKNEGMSEVVLRAVPNSLPSTQAADGEGESSSFSSLPSASSSSKVDIFATSGWDKRVRIFGADANMTPLAILKDHSDTVQCVAMPSVQLVQSSVQNLDGVVASGGKDGIIALYRLYPQHPETQQAKNSSAKDRHQMLYARLHPNATTAASNQLPASANSSAISNDAIQAQR